MQVNLQQTLPSGLTNSLCQEFSLINGKLSHERCAAESGKCCPIDGRLAVAQSLTFSTASEGRRNQKRLESVIYGDFPHSLISRILSKKSQESVGQTSWQADRHPLID